MSTTDVTHEVAVIPHGPLDVVRHSWVLAKRSLVKTWRTPEGLIDVTLSPIMVGTGYVLGFRVGTDVWHFLGGMALAVLFALCLAWGPMLIGLIARSQRAVQGIVFMTLFPLTFASNAFVPTKSMPGWPASFANANPLSHLIQALRALWNDPAHGRCCGAASSCSYLLRSPFARTTARRRAREPTSIPVERRMARDALSSSRAIHPRT